jgi:serine/threonine protein phosphatase 1
MFYVIIIKRKKAKMIKRILAIGDVHGCFSELKALLKKAAYHPNLDSLIFIGDLVDKGSEVKQTVQYAMQLVKDYNAIVIGGNHEGIFLNWLDGNDYKRSPYFRDIVGGKHTVRSFYPQIDQDGDEEKARAYIAKHYPKEIEFLRNLPDYYETESHIFVHAGIDPSKENWKETSSHDFRWIRTPFHETALSSTKKVVFGHHATNRLHEDESCFDLWFSDQKIGIDGGCVYNGNLLCLEILEGTHKQFEIKKDNQ